MFKGRIGSVLAVVATFVCFSPISSLARRSSATENVARQTKGVAPASTPGNLSSAATSISPVVSMHFRDVGAQVGLTTAPQSSPVRRYLVETMGGGGVALFDCDNDGQLDIAVINDSTIDHYLQGGDPMVTLYHQDTTSGNLHFTDVTQPAGLTTRGWGMGIAVGDFDNDGLPDLYITGYGHNVLFNRGRK